MEKLGRRGKRRDAQTPARLGVMDLRLNRRDPGGDLPFEEEEEEEEEAGAEGKLFE